MRLGTLGPGREDYYLGPVAAGLEPAGRWLGRAPAALGLAGSDPASTARPVVVEAEVLRELMAGRRPGSGERLGVRPVRVAAYEITLAAPKSLSVLWALAEGPVRLQIEEAGAAALASTVAYLERHAALVRPGPAPARGVAAAAFDHRVSRRADPHLHTHLLLLNAAPSEGGRWSALDRPALAGQADTAAALYQAELRWELTRRLGLGWSPVRWGSAQVAGIDPRLVTVFSTGRAAVARGMQAHGGRSARSASIAALVDRPARHQGLDADRLTPLWWERAEAAGFDPAEPGRLARLGPEPRPPGPAVSPDPGAVLERLGRVSSFSRRDVLEAAAAVHPSITVAGAEALADAVLASTAAVPAAPGPPRTRDVMRTGRGLVPVGTDQQRWSTAMRRQVETAALSAAGPAGRDGRLLVLDAPPGQGRHQALDAATRHWTASGRPVIAVAPDRRSASELEAATGIEVAVDRAWYSRPLGEAEPAGRAPRPVTRPPAGGVLVVAGAEAVLPGPVIDALGGAGGTSLVLVGDSRPLQRDDAGGLWRALACRPELGLDRPAVGRDRPSLAPAPAGPRAAGPAAGPVRLGRLNLADTSDAARAALVEDWHRACRRGERAVMVAVRRSDIEDLDRRAGVAGGQGARTPYRARGAGADRLLVLGDPACLEGTVDAGPISFYAVARITGEPGVTPVIGRLGPAVAGREGLTGPGPGASLAELHTRLGALGAALGPAPPDPQPALGRLDDERRSCLTALGRLEPGAPERARWEARLASVEERVAGLAPAVEARSGWVGEHAAELAELAGLASSVSERWGALGRAAELDPPPYLMGALGPPPEDRGGRALWRRAAARSEAYRERWGIEDTRRPLARRADMAPLQGIERGEAERELASVGRLLGRPPPGRSHRLGLERAALAGRGRAL
ncbi:MAG TPA: MobF family relaxase [Acidimicrobiales bacterium]|nr:MobF family relaxase [Acidimicrobiales bacterium]